jgi:cell division protease FtsH
MSLGGYVAEKMIFGDLTTGPSSDLQVATNMARAMVTRWGMSSVIGPIAYIGRNNDEKPYSEEVAKSIDHEVSKIIHEALEKAEQVLKDKKEVLDAIAKKLIEVETLEQAEYDLLISSFGIMPKKSEELKTV